MNRGSAPGRPVSKEAAIIHTKLRKLAWWLDDSILLPGGFRIGIDPLLGLVPVLGDAAGILLSGYIVVEAARLGVPRRVLLRMLLNVAVEGLIGVFPVVGDLFDAGWKANQRNVQLLDRHFESPPVTEHTSPRRVGALLALLALFVALMGALSALGIGLIWNALRS